MIRWLFVMMKHKINNTGWIWNGDETEGWNEAKPEGNAERFFNLHFLDQKWSKRSRICTCKTERTLQISGKCVQFTQSCLRTPPSYFCPQNKAEKSTQWGESSFLKELSVVSTWNMEKCPCNWIFYIAAKTTTSLRNEMKGKQGEQGKCSQTNST